MNYKLKRRYNAIILHSGFLMNAGFLIPLALTVIYTLEMPQITVWHISLFLLFSAGATYRERWIFGKERTFFNMGIFFIPLMRKDFPTSDIDQVSLKTFIRGERISTTPGSDRKWFQTEQGLLKLDRKDGSQETIIMDTNKRNIRLRTMGEELASYLEIPFVVNPEE
jgi:hypothetical protein